MPRPIKIENCPYCGEASEMGTNFLDRSTFKGYLCFRLQRDDMGNIFKDGPRYVAFRNGILVGEYSTDREAETGFRRGDSKGTRLRDYLGVDVRLRGG